MIVYHTAEKTSHVVTQLNQMLGLRRGEYALLTEFVHGARAGIWQLLAVYSSCGLHEADDDIDHWPDTRDELLFR
jgi:hypothetical protein